MILNLLIVLLILLLLTLILRKTTEKFTGQLNIIQTWKNNDIPQKYLKLINSVKILHPNANYMFFTDNDIDIFIKTKFPQYLSTFNSFKYKIEKIDFFRYLAIYYYGGLYLDLDMYMHLPFDDINDKCVFPIEFTQNSDLILQKQNFSKLIGNYAFYAPMKHPFMKLIIDNVVNKRIQIDDDTHKYVYYSAGPVLVSQSYLDFKNKKSVKLIKKKPFKKSQFGKYGEHKTMGTWKK